MLKKYKRVSLGRSCLVIYSENKARKMPRNHWGKPFKPFPENILEGAMIDLKLVGYTKVIKLDE